MTVKELIGFLESCEDNTVEVNIGIETDDMLSWNWADIIGLKDNGSSVSMLVRKEN